MSTAPKPNRTTHTPGPWEASHYYSEDGNFAVGSRAHRYLAITQTPVTDALDLDRDRERANAFLIASAPELLAAGKRLVNCVHPVEIDPDRDCSCRKDMRAAIAKAEGQS